MPQYHHIEIQNMQAEGEAQWQNKNEMELLPVHEFNLFFR